MSAAFLAASGELDAEAEAGVDGEAGGEYRVDGPEVGVGVARANGANAESTKRRRTLVVFLRHFWSPLCQDYVVARASAARAACAGDSAISGTGGLYCYPYLADECTRYLCFYVERYISYFDLPRARATSTTSTSTSASASGSTSRPSRPSPAFTPAPNATTSTSTAVSSAPSSPTSPTPLTATEPATDEVSKDAQAELARRPTCPSHGSVTGAYALVCGCWVCVCARGYHALGWRRRTRAYCIMHCVRAQMCY
ncbi:hypothetical protein FB451DRAFT_109783 [Mycena latifolia]|nr:hypothetical protein FB451DRAFT_109783 [Mycena latifolia]